MAKNEIGELIGWGIAGVGVWLAGGLFGWWSSPLSSATAAASTTTGTTSTSSTTPTPTVVLAGPVTPTINNALQANVSINGSVTNLAVIPGGDAYNAQGQDVTATLAALGVTPAQVYSLMQAAYKIQPATTTPAPTTTAAPTTTTAPTTSATTPTTPAATANPALIGGGRAAIFHPVRGGTNGAVGPVPVIRPVTTGGLRGLGAMVYATRRNYVQRGSAY